MRSSPSPRRPDCRAEALESRLLFSVPAGFVESQFTSGLSAPTAMAFAPDGRLFICEQDGRLRVVKNGTLLATNFFDLNVDSAGERGLLGITFDPNFNSNKFIYVYYTTTSGGVHNRLSRFTANGDTVLAGSEQILLELDPLTTATNHNGGALHFGNDGKLYVAVGENANGSNAQTLTNLKGKMLRLNADGSIPTDNPFFNSATGKNRAIWALGLRNPFTFAIQRTTGRMYINDVGQQTWEEINLGVAGANYGWPTTEGPTTDPRFRAPVYAYDHDFASEPGGCAITGGVFYNPTTGNFPTSFVGKYFFADLCGGYIRTLDPNNPSTSSRFAEGIGKPVDLDVGPDGSLYYLIRAEGSTPGGVFRIRNTQTPGITSHPTSRTVSVGQSTTFSVTANGAAPLSYQWQRNGANIAGATASSYTISSVQSSDNGAQFRVIVSNSFGSTTSNSATLTVTTNRAPTGTISSPAVGALYSGGQTITFAGSATDPEQGTLGASAFTWRIDLHHDSHTHPAMLPRSGITSGTYTIPNTGEVSDNVFYRVHLTVRDAGGLTHSTFRDIQPRKATIRLGTNIAGLGLTVDGQPVANPYADTGVVGVRRTIGAPLTQSLNGRLYEFVSWSDGGAATHTISTPSTDTSYIATYRDIGQSGLAATYFDNSNFTGTTVSRTDGSINFNWGTGSPASGIGADTFSVRWTAQVIPHKTETYTFYSATDDGVRVWVNNQLLIDKFFDQGGSTEHTGAIALTAGQRYNLRVDYYENGGNAKAALRWSSASTPKQIIPQGNLLRSTGVTSTSLSAAADATVRDGSSAGTNFGGATELEVKASTSGFNRQAFLKFNIGAVPSTIGSAKLRLFGRLAGTGSTNVPTGVYVVSDTSWSETGITWNGKPGTETSARASATIVDLNPRWYEWDLTGYLREAKAAGKTTIALALKNVVSSTPVTTFNSRENSANRPELVITS